MGGAPPAPVRLTLCPVRWAPDIDGAWWPHTGSVARELPELIESLHPALGEVVDININWSAVPRRPGAQHDVGRVHMAKMGWATAGNG